MKDLFLVFIVFPFLAACD